MDKPIFHNPLVSHVTHKFKQASTVTNSSASNPVFKQHLQTAIRSDQTLTISKHAQLRMNQRNIEIDSVTWNKIEQKVQEAKKMGVTDSLVLTTNAALVVSNKNNTVITAMERQDATKQIFTNINGTILID